MTHLQRQQQKQQQQHQQQQQQQQYLIAKYFGGNNHQAATETIGSNFSRRFSNSSPMQQQSVRPSPSPTKLVQGGLGAATAAATAAQQFFHSGYNIRFAVNGLSKFNKGGSVMPMNRNIQAGDFGDDAGMIAENSRCIVIGNYIFYFLFKDPFFP